MRFFDLFWVALLLLSLWPIYKQKNIELKRLKKIRSIERKRKSRVITLIHRQEMLNFLGLPLTRFINVEDSEQVLRAIRLTPDNMPIDMILHTPGGLVLASEQIALALKRHPARVTVFIPHYAMSGGAMIALAANEIVMDENAVIGPIDPQIGQDPAVSILRVVRLKNINEINDRTLILADIAEKAVCQVQNFVEELLIARMPEDQARQTAKIMSSGTWTHDYPITCEKLHQLGINAICNLPPEIHQLMELYPQPNQRRPSVQYIPVPYTNDRREGER